MTDEERGKCSLIIHLASTSAAAVGAGLAQIPLADSALILPIQVTMVVSLGRVFGIELTDSAAKAMTLGAVGTVVGRAVSQILIGWMPGIGNTLNAVTAAGLTETLGWAIANKFAAETIENKAQSGTKTSEVSAGESDAHIRRVRRIRVRIALDVENPQDEVAVVKAVQGVIDAIKFSGDDDAA